MPSPPQPETAGLLTLISRRWKFSFRVPKEWTNPPNDDLSWLELVHPDTGALTPFRPVLQRGSATISVGVGPVGETLERHVDEHLLERRTAMQITNLLRRNVTLADGTQAVELQYDFQGQDVPRRAKELVAMKSGHHYDLSADAPIASWHVFGPESDWIFPTLQIA